MTQSKEGILFIDDEEDLRGIFQKLFQKEYHVFTTGCYDEIFNILNLEDIKIVICDYYLGSFNGEEILLQVLTKYPMKRRILISGYLTTDLIMELKNNGIVHVVESKPLNFERMNILIKNQLILYERENAMFHDKAISSEELLVYVKNQFDAIFTRVAYLNTVAMNTQSDLLELLMKSLTFIDNVFQYNLQLIDEIPFHPILKQFIRYFSEFCSKIMIYDMQIYLLFIKWAIYTFEGRKEKQKLIYQKLMILINDENQVPKHAQTLTLIDYFFYNFHKYPENKKYNINYDNLLLVLSAIKHEIIPNFTSFYNYRRILARTFINESEIFVKIFYGSSIIYQSMNSYNINYAEQVLDTMTKDIVFEFNPFKDHKHEGFLYIHDKWKILILFENKTYISCLIGLRIILETVMVQKNIQDFDLELFKSIIQEEMGKIIPM